MITINILTLFPNFFESPFMTGVISGAIERGLIKINIVNMRDYGEGNYKKCDDTPYGGGPGMIISAGLFERYYKKYKKRKDEHTILFSPTGKLFDQKKAKDLSEKKTITFLLGHYEGIDARVEKVYSDETLSIGDYVLSGAEGAALIAVDAISRYLGVIGNEMSVINDTFEEGTCGLLEYEQYTRPKNIFGLSVSEVLLKGNHKDIASYRHEQSLIRTFRYRADLFAKAKLTKNDIKTIFCYLSASGNERK